MGSGRRCRLGSCLLVDDIFGDIDGHHSLGHLRACSNGSRVFAFLFSIPTDKLVEL